MRRIMAAMVEENSTDVIVDDVFSSQSISPVADKVEEIDPFKLVRQGTLSKKMKSKAYRLRKKYESLDGEVASKYQDPNTIDGYGLFSVVEPPYNLEYLASLYNESAVHNAAINSRVVSTVGLGYHWDHTLKTKRKLERAAEKDPENEEALTRARKEIQKEEEMLEELFNSFNQEETFSEILMKVWQDVRTVGNGYIEIGRRRNGSIGYIGHIPATYIRVRRHRDGFVQIMPNSGDSIFFRNFQDKQTADPISNDPNPNEIMHLKSYSPTDTYYGIPESLSAISAIIGDKFAKEYNIDYFENKAVPRYAMILKNAKLSETAKRQIVQYFRREIKGSNHGTLFIPLPKSIGNEADLEFVKLEDGIQDASFDKYRKSNRDEILISHRVPPPKVGIYDNANLAVSRDADKTYKTQVVGPDQERLEKRINRVVEEFSELLKFKFNSIDIIDEDLRSRIYDRYLRGQVMSPGEIRAELGYPVGDGDEKRLPYPTVIKEREVWLKAGYGPDGEKLKEPETMGNDKPAGAEGVPPGNTNGEAGSPPKAQQDAVNKPSTSERNTGTQRERGQAQDMGDG